MVTASLLCRPPSESPFFDGPRTETLGTTSVMVSTNAICAAVEIFRPATDVLINDEARAHQACKSSSIS